jgi:prepilin-type N-terminal cleavage/methylation domain-containing protein
MESPAEQAEMQTSPVRTPRKNSGFTLVELLIVTLIVAIFLTFASVNWNAFTPRDKESFLEAFSMEIALLKEEAISDYDEKAIEFSLGDNLISIGRIDKMMGFVKTRELAMPEASRMKDLLVNGEPFSTGKPLMIFYPTGVVDRIILHLDLKQNNYYSISVNPLTAKTTGEQGYIEEITVPGRNNPS